MVNGTTLNRDKPRDTNWAKPNCNQPGNHDEADLCQQIEMSHIAKNTLFANSVQAVLALLALAGLVITGIFTYRAANAAVDAAKHGQIAATAGTIAAKAARESADIANKALVADTRAWMTPAQVHVLDIRID